MRTTDEKVITWWVSIFFSCPISKKLRLMSPPACTILRNIPLRFEMILLIPAVAVRLLAVHLFFICDPLRWVGLVVGVEGDGRWLAILFWVLFYCRCWATFMLSFWEEGVSQSIFYGCFLGIISNCSQPGFGCRIYAYRPDCLYTP